MKATINGKPAPVKHNPLWWHKQGLSYTASGYGKRIPTEYVIYLNGRARRVYCCQYSNAGTLYVGKLSSGQIVNFHF